MKSKIIFVGTPEFGAIILEELARSDFKPILTITVPDKPVGRKKILTPTPVKIIAQKYNIPLEQPERIRNLKLEISNLKPDLGIVAAYGSLIPKDMLDIPKYGFINVHPSLLPKYRGPSPIQTAILNGDKETGVSIILMTEKMDAGPIVIVKRKTKSEKYTYNELLKELAKLGTELLLETTPKWIRGEIKPVPQDELMATYTKILKKEDGLLDWQKTADELERQVRAFNPWPGAYTFWQTKKKVFRRLKILKARVFKSPVEEKYPIGKVLVVPQNEIGIRCRKDFLAISLLQLEGGKEMTAEDFLRGYPDFTSANLNLKK